MTIELDKLAILELANRFERTFDEGDFDAHMATWIPNPSLDSNMGKYNGADAYLGWLKGFYAQVQAAGKTRHLISNAEIDIAGDTATARFYLTVVNRTKGNIMGTATFNDQLVRADDDWRFVKRVLAVDDNMKAGQ